MKHTDKQPDTTHAHQLQRLLPLTLQICNACRDFYSANSGATDSARCNQLFGELGSLYGEISDQLQLLSAAGISAPGIPEGIGAELLQWYRHLASQPFDCHDSSAIRRLHSAERQNVHLLRTLVRGVQNRRMIYRLGYFVTSLQLEKDQLLELAASPGVH